MKDISLGVFLFCLIGLNPMIATCQTKDIPPNQPALTFKNQGEQEDYWAKQLFSTSYKFMNFEKYKGQITVNGDVFTFGDETITVLEEENCKLIFKSGLIYPRIVNNNVKSQKRSPSEVNALTEQQRVFYNLGRTDSTVVSAFEECKFLNSNYKQRRFKFWLSKPGMFNPTVYFFELTNDKGNRRTSLEAFIKGARLTFFKEGWIVL